MPPRLNQGQSSFSVSQESQHVICPLKNQDGTNCRKRCLGEKRYRSMQEHIRRAHPEHYIAKLPATEESFRLMIETPPSAKPPPMPTPPSVEYNPPPSTLPNGIPTIQTDSWGGAPPLDPALMDYIPPQHLNHLNKSLADEHPMAATAAVALAQLHSQNQGQDWRDTFNALDHTYKSTSHERPRPLSSYDLPPLQDEGGSSPFPTAHPHALLPSLFDHSPPEHGHRSTTLPPIQRERSRKKSVSDNARKAKHERRLSKGYARRMSLEGRKAFSVEPLGSDAYIAKTKRWEDLIEAATSARGDDSDRDLTPMPQSPQQRASVPPLGVPSSISRNPQDQYKASPLGRALTPPPTTENESEAQFPLPSIESSNNSYSNHAHSYSQASMNYPMPSTASSYPSDSSPTFNHGERVVEIYCANCRRPSVLKDSYACVDCIAGFCVDCMYMLSGQHGGITALMGGEGSFGRAGGGASMGAGGGMIGKAPKPCPKCRGVRGEYKPFQLDLRA